jgi:hypothetical protein
MVKSPLKMGTYMRTQNWEIMGHSWHPCLLEHLQIMVVMWCVIGKPSCLKKLENTTIGTSLLVKPHGRNLFFSTT